MHRHYAGDHHQHTPFRHGFQEMKTVGGPWGWIDTLVMYQVRAFKGAVSAGSTPARSNSNCCKVVMDALI
ncbi:hypothetical protein [Chitinophaga polysaccharea]|uniref:hypothetical protein n=1 Tax=Chitinophaga polysaccharea TaxID=1293035 RepID=UPI0021AFF1AD|nr:hypothetical protein [Chitinophaga polysaccharea]